MPEDSGKYSPAPAPPSPSGTDEVDGVSKRLGRRGSRSFLWAEHGISPPTAGASHAVGTPKEVVEA